MEIYILGSACGDDFVEPYHTAVTANPKLRATYLLRSLEVCPVFSCNSYSFALLCSYTTRLPVSSRTQGTRVHACRAQGGREVSS